MTLPYSARREPAAMKPVWAYRSNWTSAPVLAGVAVGAIGLLVLVGWFVESEFLKAFLGPLVMKANTAVCFLLMGVGLALIADSSIVAAGRRVGIACISIAALIALATISQYVTGIDLGIDEALFRELPGLPGTVGAGRMSPVTTVGFVLLAVAAMSAKRVPRAVLPLCGAALALAALNIFGFVFDAAVPPALLGYSQMALNTSVAMGILSVGIIGLVGAAGPFGLLARETPTAALLRRVLAAFVVVPVVMAWMTQEGVKAGLYDASYGTALRLVVILVLGSIGVFRWANWMNQLETKRLALEFERDQFFDLSLDLMAVFDADGRFGRANHAWERTLGYPVDDLVGRSYIELIHPDDVERTMAASRHLFDEGRRIENLQNRFRRRDGTYRWLEWNSSRSPDGSIAFSIARDVSDRRRADDRRAKRERALERRNEALSERVFRDSLTGMHNRRFFDRAIARLDRRLRGLSADQRPDVAVIIFDLDHFGEVNKDYGHQAGDAVLRRFSGLLGERFRERDLVVRYGGEEFVAVLEDATTDVAVGIAEDVRTAFEQALIDVGNDTSIRVTVSAGCARLGSDGDIRSTLAQADVWLSQAKRAGRNQVVGL